MDSGFDTFMRPIVVRAQDDVTVSLNPQYERSKVGFPIRKSLDQSSFAAPQGLSQRTTSFIASQRQGIHRMLLRHLIALMIDHSCLPNMTEGGQLSLPQRPHSLFTMSLSQSPRASSPGALQNLAHYPDGARHPSPSSRRKARQMAAGLVEQDGGDRRDRTDDLMLAKHALSQLSYVP